MTLPNADRAFVPLGKLTNYCLDPANEIGQHKARVFRSALGLTATDAEALKAAILEAVKVNPAQEKEPDQFGKRYSVDFEMTGPSGPVLVRSAWIIRSNEDFPRLTSCYIPRK